MKTTSKKTLLASSIALTLGTANVEAALVGNVLGAYNWSTDSANFTMLAPNGGVFPIGTNDVVMAWDGNAYNASSDYTGPGSAANVTLSSTALFFGRAWTMHDVQMFLPGSYSFDVALGGGDPETGVLNVTIGASQLGMHMLWDWNGTYDNPDHYNVDIFVVFAQNSIFGSGLLYSTQRDARWHPTCDFGYTNTITKNCLYDGLGYGSAGVPTANQIWMLASTDPDGDGVMGIPMASGGVMPGWSPNFNANLTATPDPVPIPAAVWLFGSGLLGLVGVARRRKKN
jgi:hypothetical protein